MFAAKDLLFSRPTGYQLTRSLRFRSSASAYLNWTPASAGNRQKWTYSVWVKRGGLGSSCSLYDGDRDRPCRAASSLFLPFHPRPLFRFSGILHRYADLGRL